MDVTVVIPVWGRYVAYLAAAVQSVSAQHPRPRILVVDNASDVPLPDLGVETIRSERRLSIGAARNLGLRTADTKWAIVFDADDLMPVGTTSRLLDEAAHDPGAVAVVPRIFDDALGQAHHWPRPRVAPVSSRPRGFALLHATWCSFPTIGSLLDRETALAAGGFDDCDEGDDWVLGASLAFRGRIRFIQSFGRVYRRHPDSVSAAWDHRDVLGHAARVRRRLATDPGVPRWAAVSAPLLTPVHAVIALCVRPLARRRRQAHPSLKTRTFRIRASSPGVGSPPGEARSRTTAADGHSSRTSARRRGPGTRSSAAPSASSNSSA